MPELKHILIVSNGITIWTPRGRKCFAHCGSGEKRRLRDIFRRAERKVLAVMKRTHLSAKIGGNNIYSTVSHAVDAIHSNALTQCLESCPLLSVRLVDDAPHLAKKG